MSRLHHLGRQICRAALVASAERLEDRPIAERRVLVALQVGRHYGRHQESGSLPWKKCNQFLWAASHFLIDSPPDDFLSVFEEG